MEHAALLLRGACVSRDLCVAPSGITADAHPRTCDRAGDHRCHELPVHPVAHPPLGDLHPQLRWRERAREPYRHTVSPTAAAVPSPRFYGSLLGRRAAAAGDGNHAWRSVEGVVRVLARLKERASRLKADTYALYLVARDPRTPWYAKLLAAVVAAYAFSPIDLIPDFIPVIGYLDDLVIVPAGIWAAIKLVPPHVLAECRARAADATGGERPVSRSAAAIIVLIWLGLAALGIVWFLEVL
ncbi:MAG: DUF1232 domain-containing protein [Actinobacteria bacterium]|nr:MAG: DUF1232 domain-containing protein [Actinomycetota bacterium]